MKTHPKYEECSQYQTDDLLHDYEMMLEDFGEDDFDVRLYKFILDERGENNGISKHVREELSCRGLPS